MVGGGECEEETRLMNLYEELLALIDVLEKAGLDYALCGGVALALHGHPRFTKDIDLLVREEDLDKVRAAVVELGFTVDGGRVPFRLGTPDEHFMYRLTKVSGRETLTLDLIVVAPVLENIWSTRGVFAWKGQSIRALSREGLSAMKRIAGRTQDLADLEKLEAREDGETEDTGSEND